MIKKSHNLENIHKDIRDFNPKLIGIGHLILKNYKKFLI